MKLIILLIISIMIISCSVRPQGTQVQCEKNGLNKPIYNKQGTSKYKKF